MRSVVLVVFCVVLALGASVGLGDEAGLRGVFVGDVEPAEGDKVVGRMAIRLRQEDGSWKRVSAKHRFRTGDMFRFEVESNHDGWLEVLHRSSGEDFKELWPADSGQDSRIGARESRVVPDGRKAFIFDEETGEEHFYVAVAGESLVPKGGKKKIKNFVLRGLREEKVHTRSALATYSDDLWLYFAPSEKDEEHLAVLELQLRHE